MCFAITNKRFNHLSGEPRFWKAKGGNLAKPHLKTPFFSAVFGLIAKNLASVKDGGCVGQTEAKVSYLSVS